MPKNRIAQSNHFQSDKPFTAALIEVLNEQRDGKTNMQHLLDSLAKQKGADDE